MLIVPLPKVFTVTPGVESSIKTRSTLLSLVLSRAMSQMRSKDQHVTHIQRNGSPFMRILPCRRDPATVSKLNLHLVGPADDLQATILRCCGINSYVCCDVLDAANVVVGWCIQVSLEAVALGLLVVDFVLE